jgi:hypothetical protein
MIYTNLYTNTGANRKIPTILGILLILFVVVFFFSLTNKTAVPSRASKVNVKRAEVTNLSPIQVTVYWQTDAKETGWIIYGNTKEQLTKIALDDRDVADKKTAYTNHYVTLRNLKPGSHYYYAMISANQKIVKPDGNLFEFTTPFNSTAKTKIDPSTGKVLKANLNPLGSAIVLLFVDEKTLPLSTMTKESGEWLVPLNTFFDKTTYEEKHFSGDERARIEIISEEEGITTITSRLKDLALRNESVVIGKNYNFIDSNDVLSASAVFKNEQSNKNISIVYPLEGSLIPGRRPLVKGTAVPGMEISITINSPKTFSARVTADKDGNWNYLIPEDLELGQHTVTVKVKDRFGKETISSRVFTIVANAGNEAKVLGTASGEPTITYAPTPTSVPIVLSTATPEPTLKKAGISSLIPIISGISLLIIGSGILLVF